MFICGIGSFSHEDEDEIESYGSPYPTPKRSKRNTNFCKIIGKDNSNKNPYANRGLDKFYALLADLDDKKQKIYTRMGAEDISLVRFVYTNGSNRLKPIVVKVKEKNQNKIIKKSIKHSTSNISQPKPDITEMVPVEENPPKKRRCLRCKESFKLSDYDLKQPYFYFPLIVVLILLFLAIYGMSFAILCTSIGWYIVPTVVGGNSSSSSSSSSNWRKPKRKNEYLRKQSEKKINVYGEGPSSPKSVIDGLNEINKHQQKQHGHR